MDKLPWHDNFPRSAAEIASIVAADLPELAPVSAKRLGEGWDYSAFLINGQWVFRFPKRHQCARALRREIALLDTLEPLPTDIAVPRYVHRVARSRTFPTGYAGYAYISGTPLVETSNADPIRIGAQLGCFLREVHRRAPRPKPRTRDDLVDAIPDFRRELLDAAPALPATIVTACVAMLGNPPPTFTGEPVFTHADLGAEHILVGGDGSRIAGVIDWGDATWGDPIADIVGLWTWGGDAAAAACFEASGLAATRERWARLRFWGACYAMGSAYYGYKGGQAALHRAALSWLQRMHRIGQLEDTSTHDG